MRTITPAIGQRWSCTYAKRVVQITALWETSGWDAGWHTITVQSSDESKPIGYPESFFGHRFGTVFDYLEGQDAP